MFSTGFGDGLQLPEIPVLPALCQRVSLPLPLRFVLCRELQQEVKSKSRNWSQDERRDRQRKDQIGGACKGRRRQWTFETEWKDRLVLHVLQKPSRASKNDNDIYISFF